ncbi:MAG: cation diffusion facilitator family transporter [Opitutales bacterium]
MTELSPAHTANLQRAHASARLVLRGIALNAILAVLKIAGGVLGHTYALIADGTESVLDVLSSLLVWAGFRVAARPPDEDHPYGHGKAEALAALAVALSVFVAAGWIGWHAVAQIREPSHRPHWATLILLALVMGVKFWFSRRVARASTANSSTALAAEALHHYSDALTSTAAFVGISIAVIGGPRFAAADDWAALAACVVITFNGVSLFQRAVGDVMDMAVAPEFEHEVRELARSVPGVGAIDKCRVRKSGLSHLVDIHVRVNGELTVRAGHDIAHAVKDLLLASVPHAITDVSVHIEPMK